MWLIHLYYHQGPYILTVIKNTLAPDQCSRASSWPKDHPPFRPGTRFMSSKAQGPLPLHIQTYSRQVFKHFEYLHTLPWPNMLSCPTSSMPCIRSVMLYLPKETFDRPKNFPKIKTLRYHAKHEWKIGKQELKPWEWIGTRRHDGMLTGWHLSLGNFSRQMGPLCLERVTWSFENVPINWARVEGQ